MTIKQTRVASDYTLFFPFFYIHRKVCCILPPLFICPPRDAVVDGPLCHLTKQRNVELEDTIYREANNDITLL